jgi:hypothetical protein
MITIFICATILAILATIIAFVVEEEKEDIILGGIGFAVLGGLIGTMFAFMIGASYSSNLDNCTLKTTKTYELNPYVINNEKYYVNLSNDSTNVQYKDENGMIKCKEMASTNFVYNAHKNPMLQVKEYEPNSNPFAIGIGNQITYNIIIPNQSFIYKSLD